MLKPIETTEKTKGGSAMFVRHWAPETVRAVVVQVHGLGEHSGRYQHVADSFADRGMALLAYDHFGHGKSEGSRGHIPSYDHLLDEVELGLEMASTFFPRVPVFLYGHSWGGNIALNYLLRRNQDLQGAVITSPWLKLPTEPPAIQVFLGNMMKNIWPSFTQNTNLDHNLLTHDAGVNSAYKNDPLVHGKISALNFFSSAEAAGFALENAPKLALPTLLMHGTADGITDVSGSKQLASRAKSVEFVPWEGLYHEIHNEPAQQKDVIGKMLEYLENRL